MFTESDNVARKIGSDMENQKSIVPRELFTSFVVSLLLNTLIVHKNVIFNFLFLFDDL